jgi:hypothetical protein
VLSKACGIQNKAALKVYMYKSSVETQSIKFIFAPESRNSATTLG